MDGMGCHISRKKKPDPSAAPKHSDTMLCWLCFVFHQRMLRSNPIESHFFLSQDMLRLIYLPISKHSMRTDPLFFNLETQLSDFKRKKNHCRKNTKIRIKRWQQTSLINASNIYIYIYIYIWYSSLNMYRHRYTMIFGKPRHYDKPPC